jgi:Cu/Ag efflux pump CusA
LPIESALNGAPGVRRVRSATKIGLSVVTVEFDWGTDPYLARQVVAERLQIARAALPADVPAPTMTPAASIMGEIVFIALHSERHSGMELKNVADQVLKRRILAVPGVAEVLPIGGDTQQFQVTVKPDRLAAFNLTLDEVTQALRDANQNASAGFYVASGQEYLIQGIGRLTSLHDIANTAIAVRAGQPVLVRQVADVGIGTAPKRGVGSHNAKPAVIIGIQKQPGANTLDLTERLDLTLDEIQAGLPEGMRIERPIFRQADFITVSIENLLGALRDGAVLVIAIVFALLLSIRATAITLLAIPLSLVAAILAMKALGATINTMTLGGMAIALGALVDDAIIVVDNIVRRLRLNRAKQVEDQASAMRVVYEATKECQGSIVFATLIIMLVFLPLFSGVEGRLMAPLGFAYVISLAASLIVAIP